MTGELEQPGNMFYHCGARGGVVKALDTRSRGPGFDSTVLVMCKFGYMTCLVHIICCIFINFRITDLLNILFMCNVFLQNICVLPHCNIASL